MSKLKILFSVIIPTFNAKKYISECISSILKNGYPNYEIIVVDNSSTDDTLNYLKETFSRKIVKIKFVILGKNYGPARARNEGAKVAKGQYLAFLDGDTEVEKDWIGEALKGFIENKKIAALQCKLLLMLNRNCYDYAGEYLGSSGFLAPVASYGEKDCGQYDSFRKILAAKSAGMFIRKDVFDKIGGFDEDYFIFLEETDLGWRCWLAGYEVIFYPQSIVYHHFSATKSIVDKDFNNYLVRFHGTKNYIMTLIKNLSFQKLAFILPRHIFIWFCFTIFLIIHGNFRSAFNVLRGIYWNISNLSKILSKRKKIQANRTISDNLLFQIIMRRQSLFEKIKQFFLSKNKVQTTENN